MIEAIEDLLYAERLISCKLTSLEVRRISADLIEVFKIINNFEGLTKEDFFNINSRISRGHRFKLSTNRPHLNIRTFSFSHRILEHWNNLLHIAVEAKSINAFKNQFNPYLGNFGGFM